MTRIRLREKTRRIQKVACALVAASVVSACTTSAATVSTSTEPLTSSTSTPVTTSSTTPSPATSSATTKTPPSQSEQVQAAVVSFWAVLDRVSSDPKASLDLISTVARGSASATWKSAIAQQRARGEKQIGVTQVGNVAIRRLADARFVVTHCLDASGTDVVDSRGKSVVPADRPQRATYRAIVEAGSDARFFVTDVESVSLSC